MSSEAEKSDRGNPDTVNRPAGAPRDASPSRSAHDLNTTTDHSAATSADEPSGGGRPKTGNSSVDATCMFQDNDALKKERDVAFAVAAIEGGYISTRQLAKAIKNWTIHGDEPLWGHLQNNGLLSAALRIEIEQKAENRLQDVTDRLPADQARAAGDSVSVTTLEQLDTNGRVVKMLGLFVSEEVEEGNQQRNVVSEYQLLRKLGQGGMGAVWLARDEKLGRLVAIKEVSKAASYSPTSLDRFRREAQVTGRLEHPSIVPIYQLSHRDDTGQAFYVMRFLGKRTLEDAITEYHERRDAGDVDPMHLHRLLTAFVTVCQAIAFAHSRNVVHRDLKPENIALDDYGQVIVLDWGLAKLTGRGELQEIFGDLELNELASNESTTAGQVLGTPMYMAPEQAAGRIDEIEPTTDVYGLGAVLFAILTGYAPHEQSHQSLTSTSKVSELFQAIVSADAPDARELNPDASPELSAVCQKAMANKRYARYATALELAEDVQRWMAGEPVSTYTEPWRKRARRWVATHPRVSQLSALLATVVIVSTVTMGIVASQNRAADRRAHFEGLKADGRELRVSLQGVAAALAKDVRFMSSLPPIQGIIEARTGDGAESEEVWRGRLETIYRGLLEANPKYLSATYSGKNFEPSAATTKGSDATKSVVDDATRLHAATKDTAPQGVARELVRVERQSPGSFVRVLPASRLVVLHDSALLDQVMQLEPGEVCIDDAQLEHQEGDSQAAQGMVLTSAMPIYSDISGKVFGMVAIETDLDDIVRELLVATVDDHRSVYFIDGRGRVILHYTRDGGFQRASIGKEIGSVVPAVREFFGSEKSLDDFSDDENVYAFKVLLDPRHSSTTVGVVLTTDH